MEDHTLESNIDKILIEKTNKNGNKLINNDSIHKSKITKYESNSITSSSSSLITSTFHTNTHQESLKLIDRSVQIRTGDKIIYDSLEKPNYLNPQKKDVNGWSSSRCLPYSPLGRPELHLKFSPHAKQLNDLNKNNNKKQQNKKNDLVLSNNNNNINNNNENKVQTNDFENIFSSSKHNQQNVIHNNTKDYLSNNKLNLNNNLLKWNKKDLNHLNIPCAILSPRNIHHLETSPIVKKDIGLLTLKKNIIHASKRVDYVKNGGYYFHFNNDTISPIKSQNTSNLNGINTLLSCDNNHTLLYEPPSPDLRKEMIFESNKKRLNNKDNTINYSTNQSNQDNMIISYNEIKNDMYLPYTSRKPIPPPPRLPTILQYKQKLKNDKLLKNHNTNNTTTSNNNNNNTNSFHSLAQNINNNNNNNQMIRPNSATSEHSSIFSLASSTSESDIISSNEEYTINLSKDIINNNHLDTKIKDNKKLNHITNLSKRLDAMVPIDYIINDNPLKEDNSGINNIRLNSFSFIQLKDNNNDNNMNELVKHENINVSKKDNKNDLHPVVKLRNQMNEMNKIKNQWSNTLLNNINHLYQDRFSCYNRKFKSFQLTSLDKNDRLDILLNKMRNNAEIMRQNKIVNCVTNSTWYTGLLALVTMKKKTNSNTMISNDNKNILNKNKLSSKPAESFILTYIKSVLDDGHEFDVNMLIGIIMSLSIEELELTEIQTILKFLRNVLNIPLDDWIRFFQLNNLPPPIETLHVDTTIIKKQDKVIKDKIRLAMNTNAVFRSLGEDNSITTK